MKTLLITPLLYFLLYSAHCQEITYNFSSKKDGYSGPVKRVTSYVLDLVPTDRFLDKNGTLRFVKYYNEKGLLLKTESYANTSKTDTRYEYDEKGNVQSINKRKNGVPSGYKDEFFYYPGDRTIVQKLSHPENYVIGRPVVKKVLHLDENNNLTQLEYLDSLDLVVMSTRLYYDNESNLIQSETYKITGFMNKFFQTFDTNGKRKIIQSIDKKGDFMFRTVFSRIDDETELMEYVGSEHIVEKHKEVCKKDHHGNTIKTYVYDLIAGTTMVYEYVIEYYK